MAEHVGKDGVGRGGGEGGAEINEGLHLFRSQAPLTSWPLLDFLRILFSFACRQTSGQVGRASAATQTRGMVRRESSPPHLLTHILTLTQKKKNTVAFSNLRCECVCVCVCVWVCVCVCKTTKSMRLK